MSLKSWGNYPKINSQILNFNNYQDLSCIIKKNHNLISYGYGRSYGDSALSKKQIQMRPNKLFLEFDKLSGILHVQSGVLLSEILDSFISKGWFLKIVPGTKFVTIGGAIASDIHGKNHHREGCFSECVEMFHLMLPDGSVVRCSRKENLELFLATCGGMGLTGVILDAKIQLTKIQSKYINQQTIKTENLKETFEAFEKYKNASYSVAWIDCLAKGFNLGRCLLMVGDFSSDGVLDYQVKKKISIPFYFSSFFLNSLTVKAFNYLYYSRMETPISNQKIDIDKFFFPLDSIAHWNRIYGKNGFIQYQFILPKDASFIGLEQILKEISKSGKGSFLAVLKLYGEANQNYLSFPMKGYSLALDFKMETGIFELLNRLDKIVVKYRGRIYLSKDSRVSQEVFEQGYPEINQFRKIRKKYSMNEKFNSLQSIRLDI